MTSRSQGFLESKLEALPPLEEGGHFTLSLIPFEKTTTYKKGTRLGPEAIIDASGHIELLDESLRIDASTWGIRTLRPPVPDLKSISAHASEVAGANPGALLGFLGGEHSITPAILEGLTAGDIGIVWIDAHADLRERYLGSKDNHACAGFNSAPFGRIVQVGIRSLAEEEVEYLSGTNRVKSFRYWNRESREAVSGLPQRVYLSIDLDGFSPTLMRAVGTPEPGGLSWEEVLDILDFVFEAKDVVAYDVVELCPQESDVVSSFTAARLVYKIMAYHAHHKLRHTAPPLFP